MASGIMMQGNMKRILAVFMTVLMFVQGILTPASVYAEGKKQAQELKIGKLLAKIQNVDYMQTLDVLYDEKENMIWIDPSQFNGLLNDYLYRGNVESSIATINLYEREFKSSELNNYFNSKSWYQQEYASGATIDQMGDYDEYIVNQLMNSIERENLNLISHVEQSGDKYRPTS